MKVEIGKIFAPRNIRYIVLGLVLLLVCNTGYPIYPMHVPAPSLLYTDAAQVLGEIGAPLSPDAHPYTLTLRLGDAGESLMGIYHHYAPSPVPLSDEASVISDPGYISILEMLSLDIIGPYPDFIYAAATHPSGYLFARMLTRMHNRIEADAYDSWHAHVTVREVQSVLGPVYRIATESIQGSSRVPDYEWLYDNLSLPDRDLITKGQFYTMARHLTYTVIASEGGEVSVASLSPDLFLSDDLMTRMELTDATDALIDTLAQYFPPEVDGEDGNIEIGRLAAHFRGRQPLYKMYRSVQNDRAYSWYLDQGDSGPYAAYNCAPCCTAMIARWYDPACTLSPSELCRPHPDDEAYWTTDDIKACLDEYGIPYHVEPMADAGMIAAIEDGCLLLLVVDLGQGNHTILVKGYRQLGEDIWLTCYDPASWGMADPLGAPIGQDAEYHMHYLLDVLRWEYYLCIPSSFAQ